MANRHSAVDLLPRGTDVSSLDKGTYTLNVYWYGDHFRVRYGFGQHTQLDTTLGFADVVYGAHLGSYPLKTDFGHEQIVSVYQATDIFTGGLARGTDARTIGQFTNLYLVSIYDLDTGESWEEILLPKTSEGVKDINERHGVYETDLDQDHEDYLHATDDSFFFEEFQDILYFGSRRAGVWGYVPASFRGKRVKQINSVDYRNCHYQAYSESSLVDRVVPADGMFTDAWVYLSDAEFPRPTDVAALLGRLVYVDGKTVYFSDVGRPNSVVADNFITIPSENDVEAITELNGNLLVWTGSEMFLYQPSPTGALVSGGRLTKVSDHVGCLSPNALTKAKGRVVWCDRNGAYVTSNGLDVQTISGPIEPFWLDSISSPLTQYYQESGAGDLNLTQPRMLHKFDPDNVNMTFDHVRNLVLLTIPTQNITLVFDLTAWQVWTYDSVAGAANEVRTTSNIENPWLVMGEDNLYLVGSRDRTAIDDATLNANLNPANENFDIDSHVILEYGRGGGLDRSIEVESEDQRRIAGKWYSDDATMTSQDGDNSIYIGEWVKVPDDYVFPNGQVANDRTYLLPVEVAPDENATPVLPDYVKLIFRFDRTHWEPIFTGANSTEVDYILPPERLASAAGYSQGAPVSAPAGSESEVQVYEVTTGNPDRGGEELRLHWNGTVGGYTGPHAPRVNLNHNQRNRFIFLPFKYVGALSDDVVSMGIVVQAAEVQDVTAANYTLKCRTFVWQQAEIPNSRHSADDVAQPVDWAIKTPQLDDEGRQLRARGVQLRVESHGSADTQVQGSAVFGLLNAVLASDWKGWTSQIIDYGGNIKRITDKTSIRTRLRNLAGTTMVGKVFGSADAHWGNPADSAHGNVLIDDTAVDTIDISDSVKGEHFSWLLFGHVRNAAESLFVSRIRGYVQKAGQHRRRGR